jgi:hypothetical protein
MWRNCYSLILIVYNGLVATLYSKPLNRLFYTPRCVFIESICKSYPRNNPTVKHGTMKVRDKDVNKDAIKVRDKDVNKDAINTISSISPSSLVSTLNFRCMFYHSH